MTSGLSIVVKYWPPLERISGVIGFVSALADRLSDQLDVEVITSGRPGPTTVPSEVRVHHTGRRAFPLAAAIATARRRDRTILIVNGINDPRTLGPYWLPCISAARRPAFFQATNLAGPPTASMRAVLGRCGPVFCASTGIERHLRDAGITDTVRLLPGVDLAQHGYRPPRDRVRRIGFVNHVNSVKGADLAARAMADLHARHPELEFVFAGTGDADAEVDAILRTVPVDRRGFLDTEERISLMGSCDVMLLPFRTEVSVLGISQTALECMALGTVVVGSATPSIDAAVDDGRTGLLADDAPELVAAVESLISSPDTTTSLARAARDRVEAEHDIDGVRDRLLAALTLG